MSGYTDEQIAWVVHEANRALQGVLGDSYVSAPWTAEEAELKASAVAGVRQAMKGRTPAQLHDDWCDWKREHGWVYGPVKDEQQKTHPCLVPYGELDDGQKTKDRVFAAIVAAMTDAGVQ